VPSLSDSDQRERIMDRREKIRLYKETPRPAGVFRIVNTTNGKSLLGSSPDLPGMLNRQRFQLENGSHPDRELQNDWNNLGSDVFTFEILDKLEPPKEPGYDPSEDLRALKQLWLDKYTESGEPLYSQSRRDRSGR
jgi:hypothetical protein